MARNKTVAIIGAGPSGLVSAKFMLAAGLHPTVFDKRPHIGGLWAPPAAGTVNLKPSMKTNITKYAISLSDNPWDRRGRSHYPTVVEVAEYLEKYRETHIKRECLKLGCEVVDVKKEGDGGGWRVKWRRDGNGEEGVFDYLVIASGYYAQTYVPDLGDVSGIKAVHSADYTFDKVYSPDIPEKQKIVIIGGALSSAEEAADVALRVSSLPPELQRKVEIVHIFPRPFHSIPKQLPLANPSDDAAPSFQPTDFVFYDCTRFGQPQPTNISPEDRCRILNGICRNMLGGKSDEHVVSEELRLTEEDMENPPQPTLTDAYTGFVRSGRIKTLLGRVVEAEENKLIIRCSERQNPEREVKDVTAAIYCTGYKTALEGFLGGDLLPVGDVKIGYTPKSSQTLPVYLYKNTLSQNFGPNAGFVGFFPSPGPFWSSVELQARWLAGLFSGKLSMPTDSEFASYNERLLHAESTGGFVALKDALGDYLEWLLDLGTQSGLSVFSEPLTASQAPRVFFPARISPPSPRDVPMIAEYREDVSAVAPKNRFIRDAIFRALHGAWGLDRVFDSNLEAMPSGHFTGIAEFIPRLATFSYDLEKQEVLPLDKTEHLTTGGEITEYLYSEEGVFTFDHGASMSANMKYIYRWDPHTGRISVWYVKSGETEVDRFFYEIEIVGAAGAEVEENGEAAASVVDGKKEGDGVRKKGGWKAKGTSHLCGADWYRPQYRFAFRGCELGEVEILYDVKGPKKDYRAVSTLIRPALNTGLGD